MAPLSALVARRSARRWLRLADRWERRLQDRTVTTNGPLSPTPYYLRLSKDGDPDAGTAYASGDGGPSEVDQRLVVDPSFLTLVRWGIEKPDDPTVLSTLDVITWSHAGLVRLAWTIERGRPADRLGLVAGRYGD